MALNGTPYDGNWWQGTHDRNLAADLARIFLGGSMLEQATARSRYGVTDPGAVGVGAGAIYTVQKGSLTQPGRRFLAIDTFTGEVAVILNGRILEGVNVSEAQVAAANEPAQLFASVPDASGHRESLGLVPIENPRGFATKQLLAGVLERAGDFFESKKGKAVAAAGTLLGLGLAIAGMRRR